MSFYVLNLTTESASAAKKREAKDKECLTVGWIICLTFSLQQVGFNHSTVLNVSALGHQVPEEFSALMKACVGALKSNLIPQRVISKVETHYLTYCRSSLYSAIYSKYYRKAKLLYLSGSQSWECGPSYGTLSFFSSAAARFLNTCNCFLLPSGGWVFYCSACHCCIDEQRQIICNHFQLVFRPWDIWWPMAQRLGITIVLAKVDWTHLESSLTEPVARSILYSSFVLTSHYIESIRHCPQQRFNGDTTEDEASVNNSRCQLQILCVNGVLVECTHTHTHTLFHLQETTICSKPIRGLLYELWIIKSESLVNTKISFLSLNSFKIYGSAVWHELRRLSFFFLIYSRTILFPLAVLSPWSSPVVVSY